MFGGTVYAGDGVTAVPHVEVGIRVGSNFYGTYSGANGNIWLGGAGNIDWANAEVRLRDGNGEITMSGATPAGACNSCHGSGMRIAAP